MNTLQEHACGIQYGLVIFSVHDKISVCPEEIDFVFRSRCARRLEARTENKIDRAEGRAQRDVSKHEGSIEILSCTEGSLLHSKLLGFSFIRQSR